jgi:hypothetical protein
MKKLIFNTILLSVFMLSYSTVMQGKSWWSIAGADGAGALGGAAAGSAIPGVGTAGGAIFGGVCGSLMHADKVIKLPPVKTPTFPEIITSADKTNPYNNYGEIHNKIIIDFFNQGFSKLTDESLVFISQRINFYGIKCSTNLVDLKKVRDAVIVSPTTEQIISLLANTKDLKANEQIKSSLIKISNATSIEQSNAELLNMQNNASKMGLPKEKMNEILLFAAIYIHSTYLWAKIII